MGLPLHGLNSTNNSNDKPTQKQWGSAPVIHRFTDPEMEKTFAP